MSIQSKLPKRLKSLLTFKTILVMIFAFVVTMIIIFSNDIFNKITNEYKFSIYKETSERILSKYQLLLNEKIDSSFLIASALSKNQNIKNYLLTKEKSNLDLRSILEDMHTKKEYVNIWIEIISKEGISLLKNWNDSVGENVFNKNFQLSQFTLNPKSITTINANIFGMFISNTIPIYDKSELLGYFTMNMQLDDISSTFEEEGYKSVILLNKDDSSKIIQEFSYSQTFIDDIYIVNKNADNYLMKVIKQSGVEKYFLSFWPESYKVEEASRYLISKLQLENNDGLEIASLFIFKNLDEVKMKNITRIKDVHISIVVLIIVLILFILYIIYSISKTKLLDKNNRLLTIINEELIIKTDEMDYNDKKLENLFNMQPNLMIMHNGKEIKQANKRFLGFFNRFKTLNGFRQKHKCVSELFVEYNAPNYISTQMIKGVYWIDYILSNPKNIYKVVIPYKDSKIEIDHHFIIKLNEMEYAGKVDERLIIVALVDITQDMVNYKTIAKDIKNV